MLVQKYITTPTSELRGRTAPPQLAEGCMASLRVASDRGGSLKDVSPCFSNRSDIYRREMQVVS